LPNVGPYIYTTLAFLALLGAPYIYDISSLRVNILWMWVILIYLRCFSVSSVNFLYKFWSLKMILNITIHTPWYVWVWALMIWNDGYGLWTVLILKQTGIPFTAQGQDCLKDKQRKRNGNSTCYLVTFRIVNERKIVNSGL